ncbi:MPT63 family protein [[Mycobacterium] kokjensenii]|uniref:MPT63 family protein n=1 Tax=[Mycobacterium] kokjensenii TaxID=3064287 RepID=A0ABN9NC40_9MYCO|nr:MPT63 family protein [Mycolicibacter sp. MU0083]CAJ1502045.1 MPT63 family protein [Mycolicibacter sp. MU0083]
MKFSKTAAKTAVGAAGIAAFGVLSAAAAHADPAIRPFGATEQLDDGAMATSYTVSNLGPANIVIPGYQPQGTLYQADVTARADRGTVTPLVADFNARAADSKTYRVINTVPTPGGINPEPIVQGQQASGKVYFDVTGAPPDGVVYNDGVQDVLIWSSKA